MNHSRNAFAITITLLVFGAAFPGVAKGQLGESQWDAVVGNNSCHLRLLTDYERYTRDFLTDPELADSDEPIDLDFDLGIESPFELGAIQFIRRLKADDHAYLVTSFLGQDLGTDQPIILIGFGVDPQRPELAVTHVEFDGLTAQPVWSWFERQFVFRFDHDQSQDLLAALRAESNPILVVTTASGEVLERAIGSPTFRQSSEMFDACVSSLGPFVLPVYSWFQEWEGNWTADAVPEYCGASVSKSNDVWVIQAIGIYLTRQAQGQNALRASLFFPFDSFDRDRDPVPEASSLIVGGYEFVKLERDNDWDDVSSFMLQGANVESVLASFESDGGVEVEFAIGSDTTRIVVETERYQVARAMFDACVEAM